MKKLILSLTAVVAIALSANAQTEKGKWILGGTASYDSQKSDADGAKASETLSLVPNLGYFVSDNFALGTGVGYNYSKVGTASPSGYNEAFVVSPFGRYYVGLSDQFKFFGQAAVPLAFGTVKATDANGEAGAKVGSSTAVGVALSPGFAYFPTKKIGIEFAFRGISYNNYRVEDSAGNEVKGAGYDRFSIGTNFFTPQIGVQFHF
ncbi:outer membrane beta-barrel protein [Daejeonella lutea]|uniref:Opacity protein n=1 Tax=Daejeonella lutea TaxID=572036 RepID=A0A1T5EYR9_9SPHI|nr:outer membrane beta-barrel protein [Daejeonella lutea]SKB89028.1 Opacity protein [Daejeonella lutea]